MVTICLACRGGKTKILRKIQSKYDKIKFVKNKDELETVILEIFEKEWDEQRRIYKHGNEDIACSEN